MPLQLPPYKYFSKNQTKTLFKTAPLCREGSVPTPQPGRPPRAVAAVDAGTGAGRPVQMVETLDSLEVSFAFGINHEVSDQVTGLDDATHVVAVLGNRVAMVNTEQQDYQLHGLSNDTRTATA